MNVQLVYFSRQGSEEARGCVGRIVTKRTYISDRLWKDHFFRKFNGFAISQPLLPKLKGVDCIQFNTDRGNFMIKLDDFLEFSSKENYSDPQLICPLNRMKRVVLEDV